MLCVLEWLLCKYSVDHSGHSSRLYYFLTRISNNTVNIICQVSLRHVSIQKVYNIEVKNILNGYLYVSFFFNTKIRYIVYCILCICEQRVNIEVIYHKIVNK